MRLNITNFRVSSRQRRSIGLFFCVALLLSGCSPARGSSGVGRDDERAPIMGRAINSRPKDLILVNSLYLARPTFSNPELVSASAVSSENLYSIIRKVASSELSLKTISDSAGGKVTALSFSDSLLAAKREGADSLLTTEVRRFFSREGSAVGATQPASVSFVMSVFKVSDGGLVWSSAYDFVDTSLAEDVVKFNEQLGAKGGVPSWASAESLFEEGFSKGIRDLYERRNSQFLVR